MNETLSLLIAIAVAFIGGMIITRKKRQTDAEIIDLTARIKQNQIEAAKKRKEAANAVDDYRKALRSYDPFFNDDDDGKPPA